MPWPQLHSSHLGCLPNPLPPPLLLPSQGPDFKLSRPDLFLSLTSRMILDKSLKLSDLIVSVKEEGVAGCPSSAPDPMSDPVLPS